MNRMFSSKGSNWFVDSATPMMEGIVDLHNYINFYLVLVVVFVLYMILTMVYEFFYSLYFNHRIERLATRYTVFAAANTAHGTVLEIVWTLIPSVILMLIAIPSFSLLYSMDEVILPGLVLKVIGYQWYWAYEYSGSRIITENGSKVVLEPVRFSSYVLPERALTTGQFRLLEVDKPIVLPAGVHVRAIVTANDVIHSWAIPALGIKIDAVPGRLNRVNIFANRRGTFYGQCSEICGVSHGNMPIQVHVVGNHHMYLNRHVEIADAPSSSYSDFMVQELLPFNEEKEVNIDNSYYDELNKYKYRPLRIGLSDNNRQSNPKEESNFYIHLTPEEYANQEKGAVHPTKRMEELGWPSEAELSPEEWEDKFPLRRIEAGKHWDEYCERSIAEMPPGHYEKMVEKNLVSTLGYDVDVREKIPHWSTLPQTPSSGFEAALEELNQRERSPRQT